MIILIVFLQFLINFSYSVTWSHLNISGLDGENSYSKNSLVSQWILNNDNIRYCVFIEDENFITKEEASIEIKSAFKNWLSSLNFYEKINLYKSKGFFKKINIDKIKTEELNCSFQKNNNNNYKVIALDNKNNLINTDKYITFIFKNENKINFYCQAYYDSNDKKAAKRALCGGSYDILFSIKPDALNKTIISPNLDVNTEIEFNIDFEEHQAIILISNKFGDSYSKVSLRKIKNMSLSQLEEFLTITVPNKVKILNKPYSYNEFIDELETLANFHSVTFTTIIHEIGHAFGLGDEYAGGLQQNNNINYMSSNTNKSIMKDCNIFYPTIDDVIGLTYLFDRLARRNINKRSFTNFNNCEHSIEVNNCVFYENEDFIILANGKRSELNFKINLKKPNIDKITIFDKKLSFDYLSSLIDELSKFSFIKKLELINNSIPGLAENISKLNNIQELTVSYNEIKHFTLDIFSLINLAKLNLSYNEIKIIPDDILKLKNLEYLDLSSNLIKKIPSNIKELEKLKYLNLKNNPLSLIEALAPNLEILAIDLDKLDEASKNLINQYKLNKPNLLIL